MRLENRVCLVTGGGSGIGRETCRLFSREGARLAVADRDGDSARGTADACGGEAVALTADVSDPEDARRMVEDTVARFGRLDVLVNNAGYGVAGTVIDTDLSQWDALMAVNVTGVFLGCKHAIPVMIAQGGGVVVNVASVVAHVGIRNRAAYCASKGAVAALTRAMAIDHVDDNVRINAIAPGTIRTPYFDEIVAGDQDGADTLRRLENRQAMKRLGEPREIAAGMLYLASDESSFCTGTVLTVDGGMTAY